MPTPGTIEETYEHRMKLIIKGILKHNGITPATAEELFDFLDDDGAKEFAKAVVADMTMWADEDFWLQEVTR